MDQPSLFTPVPTVDTTRVSPTGAPFAAGSHSSYTGAVHATEARSANIVALRQLWRAPHTMQEIAGITGLPLASVCSLKAGIPELGIVDYETIEWGDGRKATKRARWQLPTVGAACR